MSITLHQYQSKLTQDLTSMARQRLYENVDERNRKTKENLKYVNLITGVTDSKTNGVVHIIIGRHAINYLSCDELLNFSHVCKDWHAHCEDPKIWSNMLMRDINAPLQDRIDATNSYLHGFSKLYYKRQMALKKINTTKKEQQQTDKQQFLAISVAIFRLMLGVT